MSIAERLPAASSETRPKTRPAGIPGDHDWVLENFDNLLSQFPDQWIAVRDRQVVAHSPTAAGLREAMLTRPGLRAPLITHCIATAWDSVK